MSLTIYETIDDIDFQPSYPAKGRDTGSDGRLIWEDSDKKGTKVVIWKAEPGLYVIPARDLDETFVIIEGEALCSLNESEPVKITTGSIVHIAKGVAITLDVSKPLRKVATIVLNP
ncbi:cupin domain-containing protein [Paenochrobactrum sp. BZR 588]|uniref:cupin domain-containing protein n=1 Tax=unclassified Paenochrobactrum TaxID=2639760 RepID=UPI00385217F2